MVDAGSSPIAIAYDCLRRKKPDGGFLADTVVDFAAAVGEVLEATFDFTGGIVDDFDFCVLGAERTGDCLVFFSKSIPSDLLLVLVEEDGLSTFLIELPVESFLVGVVVVFKGLLDLLWVERAFKEGLLGLLCVDVCFKFDADLVVRLGVLFPELRDVFEVAEEGRFRGEVLPCMGDEALVREAREVVEDAFSDVTDADLRESEPTDFWLATLEPDPVLLIPTDDLDAVEVCLDVAPTFVDLAGLSAVFLSVTFLSALVDTEVVLLPVLTDGFLVGEEVREESDTVGDFILVNGSGRASYILPRLPLCTGTEVVLASGTLTTLAVGPIVLSELVLLGTSCPFSVISPTPFNSSGTTGPFSVFSGEIRVYPVN